MKIICPKSSLLKSNVFLKAVPSKTTMPNLRMYLYGCLTNEINLQQMIWNLELKQSLMDN